MRVELTAEEIRVLACLVEKEATTPDSYPLSTNALINACNQTTSRDPVMSLSERFVDAALLSLRELGLARTIRGDGQRVNKHKHVMGEALSLPPPQLAVLSVLMLRGPQTAAELRARTERYGAGLDADAVESALAALASRDEPLARQLERRPGEREGRWLHLLGDPASRAAPPAAASSGADTIGGEGPVVRSISARVEALEAEVAALREQIGALSESFDRLTADLGV